MQDKTFKRVAGVVLVVILVSLFGFLAYHMIFGWSANTRARESGGKMELEINAGEELISCEWKDSDKSLWYLVQLPREEGKPRSYEYRQKTPSGTWEGRVIIREKPHR